METILNQKRVMITGGTSGLGRALALTLADQGARVAIVARHRVALDETVTAAHPAELIAIQADVSAKEEVYRISSEAIARLGGVDLLINNASYLGVTPLRTLLDTECEEFQQVLETNLLGPFRLTKAILPTMLLQGGGLVINISSDAAESAYPGWGAYGSSKAALAHLSRIWDEELKTHRVRFFAIDPGEIDTPMHAAALPEADPATLRSPKAAALLLLEPISNAFQEMLTGETDDRR
ncbi:MAG: SDR family oxidoreductase [Nitrospirae bacterium]|nr:SDR family oxidoreductase [Candidatus Manganitrophaceae bacterium]